MFNLNLFFNLCLIEINKININVNKKRYEIKYSNEYFLKMNFYMYSNVNQLSFLSKLKSYKSKL